MDGSGFGNSFTSKQMEKFSSDRSNPSGAGNVSDQEEPPFAVVWLFFKHAVR